MKTLVGLFGAQLIMVGTEGPTVRCRLALQTPYLRRKAPPVGAAVPTVVTLSGSKAAAWVQGLTKMAGDRHFNTVPATDDLPACRLRGPPLPASCGRQSLFGEPVSQHYSSPAQTGLAQDLRWLTLRFFAKYHFHACSLTTWFRDRRRS